MGTCRRVLVSTVKHCKILLNTHLTLLSTTTQTQNNKTAMGD